MGGCLGSPANKPYGQQGYGQQGYGGGYGGYPQQQGYGQPGQYGHNFQPNYGAPPGGGYGGGGGYGKPLLAPDLPLRCPFSSSGSVCVRCRTPLSTVSDITLLCQS